MIKLESISIKKSPELNEAWVQQQIALDPTIIGLGDLVLKDKERIQAGTGRLDLLLQDVETLKRYEVEIQLGASDETHLIRTIEYWDLERKRYPQYSHVAVIIAEDITSRFLNVIQLFNGHIPLIAIKMTAYKIDGKYALTFVKVIDEIQIGLVDTDEETAEPTDRAYWEQKSSKPNLKLVDELLLIINEVEPLAKLKYNKHYIGLEVNGITKNFAQFQPRRSFVLMRFHIVQNEEISELLESSDFDVMTYDKNWKNYRLKIDEVPKAEARSLFRDLAKKAQEQYEK